MGKEISTLGDIEIEKKKKKPPEKSNFLEKLEIEIVLGSNKISLVKKSYKNINGYLYNDYKVKSLHIMLPKTRAYVKSYD